MDNSTPGMSQKLVQYLDGELTSTEEENLVQQLAADKALQDELESLKLTSEAVKLYGLQKRVSGIHLQMMEELQPPVRKINSSKKIIRYSIAAAAILVLIIGSYMAYNFYSLSADKVFASNYQSYQLVTVRDGSGVETPVEKAYRGNNYAEIIRIHDAGEDHTSKGEFLCGVAALELKENDKAVQCFKEVLDTDRQTGQSILKDEAEYYLSLTYIRNKDYENALVLMNKIQSNPDHLYNEKISSKLIRQVKMLKKR